MEISENLANRVRLEMKSQGWSIVDTTSFFEDLTNWDLPLFENFEPIDNVTVGSMGGHYQIGNFVRRSMASVHELTGIKPGAKAYFIWIEDLLRTALPDETFWPYIVNLREETDERKTLKIDDWHHDGGYIRTSCALEGKGTEILPEDGVDVFSVPEKHTLLFSGFQRDKPLLHRRPNPVTGESRRLIIMTFENQDDVQNQ